MKKIIKILSIRINFLMIFGLVSACAAPGDQRATDDVGPVSAYARNTLAQENPAGLIRVGEGFERSGDYAGARTLYRQAIAVDPTLVEAKIAYARVSARVGAGDEAVAVLTQVLTQEPDNRTALTTLADIHANAARYRAALGVLERILTPGVEELVLKGKVEHSLGNNEAGAAVFIEALDRAPDSPQILEAAALSYALQGNFPSAVALLRRAMDDARTASDARKSLAKVYALSGQGTAALRLARDIMTPDEIGRIEFLYRLLPRLDAKAQAEVLYFNRVPKEAVERISSTATN